MSDATRPQTKPLFGHWCANTLVRILLRASLTTMVALLMLALNPFGFTRWTQLRSHDLWERVQAPAYDDTHGRDAVSIVYLDETTLRSASLARPLRLREHEMMLDDIVRPGRAGKAPEAVFVDFAFDQAADPAGAQAAL